ncbi:MAG TPA: DUF362 domain-containing protein [Symbiobacteriaceae bacterium]|nr:DUF362 domain-containing protein [Symbiobacteriaceae bacterium]
MPREKVFIGRCERYDPAEIARVIARGLDELGAWERIRGKVAVKPNLVMAHPVEARHCFTRAEFMEGLLTHLAELKRQGRVSQVDVVEKCGRGAPTRTMFRHAGYLPLARRFGATLHPMEEEPRVPVSLQRGVLHKQIHISPHVAGADTLIFTPKLKSNVLAHGISAALKLNIGSVDDDERMQFHDHRLDDKIVDILEACYPALVITDAIEIAVGGNQMTEGGKPLGAILVATNPLAHDLVAARLLNLDPAGVGHLRRAAERGYTPATLDEVEVIGDFPLEQAQAVTAQYDLGFIRVEAFESPMSIRSGEPYCTGGCHGVFLDWLHMLKDRMPEAVGRLPENVTVVIGEVKEPVVGDRVLLYGDCAACSANVQGRRVSRIRGCPPNHKNTILWMALKYRIFGPLFKPDLVWAGYVQNPASRVLGWFRRMLSR